MNPSTPLSAVQSKLKGVVDRVSTLVRRRPSSTEGHTETARETGVALGLMAQAADAAEPTPEQQIFLSQSEHGMRERLSRLLDIPHRSLAQEREKLAIEGWLARGATQEAVQAPRRFLGPLMAAAGPWSLLLTPWTLVVAGLALTGVQTARLNHAKADLSVRTHELRQAVDAANGWEERYQYANQGLIDAANVARLAAQNLETERAAHARAAAAERRRNREIANVLAHSAEPPAWRLRDDEPAADQPAAPTP